MVMSSIVFAQKGYKKKSSSPTLSAGNFHFHQFDGPERYFLFPAMLSWMILIDIIHNKRSETFQEFV